MNAAIIAFLTDMDDYYTWWRDDMRWLWLLVGLLLLLSLLTLFYLHHHHRAHVDMYRDNCNVQRDNCDTVQHIHTYQTVDRTGYATSSLDDRLARGEITQAEYEQLKKSFKA